MSPPRRKYIVLSALFIILALLLPVIGTMVVAYVCHPDDVTGPSGDANVWPQLFAAISVAVIMLNTLLVTCPLSCVSAGIAIRLASLAVICSRAEKKATILPHILRVTAIIELAVAALVTLIPLILLFRFLTL